MVQMFPEHSHNEVAHTNVRSLCGVRREAIGGDAKVEPIRGEGRQLPMSDLQVGAVGGCPRQKAVHRKTMPA